MSLNLRLVRRYAKGKRNLEGIFGNNPVLVLGLALPFAVVCSTSVQNATILSIAMLFTLVPTLVLCSLFGRKIPSWLHMVVFPIIAALLLIPVTVLVTPITPNISDSLGFYLQIISVNTLLIYSISPCIYQRTPLQSLTHGLLNVGGFALVVFVLSIIREVLGNGTFWNVPIPGMSFKFYGLLLPFAGFILIGVLAALSRTIHRIILTILINVERVRIQEAALDLKSSGK